MTHPPDSTISVSVPAGAGRAPAVGMIGAVPTAKRQALGGEPARKPRNPRKPTLTTVAKQASKAAIPVARYEIKPDGTVVVVTGKPEPAESADPWPLDEFRTKETKQ